MGIPWEDLLNAFLTDDSSRLPAIRESKDWHALRSCSSILAHMYIYSAQDKALLTVPHTGVQSLGMVCPW